MTSKKAPTCETIIVHEEKSYPVKLQWIPAVGDFITIRLKDSKETLSLVVTNIVHEIDNERDTQRIEVHGVAIAAGDKTAEPAPQKKLWLRAGGETIGPL